MSKKNINDNLKKLSEIAEWFDNRDEVDVEEGLKKVKDAVAIIKESKERLKEIENEFEEIKNSMDEELPEDSDM
ncbi:MAG: exodeoxyribonuclease VII small subunit [Candidatus Nealsonbacteria bacterium]|nr:exodeoxyribonuclease VII small subunit [Candidatus Nealsonbacteria bacterium]